jgi:hypothetical protein
MDTVFKGVTVTTEDILKALSNFDVQCLDPNEYDSWLEKKTYKYAVQHGEKLYPRKYILSQATGIDTSEFNSGNQTNSVFRKLGLRVINKP